MRDILKRLDDIESLLTKLNSVLLKGEINSSLGNNQHTNSIFEGKKVFTIKDASEFTSLSIWTLYHKTSLKQIPHYHRGRKLVFLKSELEKWMLENPVKTMNQLENEASNYVNIPHKNRRNK